MRRPKLALEVGEVVQVVHQENPTRRARPVVGRRDLRQQVPVETLDEALGVGIDVSQVARQGLAPSGNPQAIAGLRRGHWLGGEGREKKLGEPGVAGRLQNHGHGGEIVSQSLD